jgi:hypothetical protein
MKFYDLDYTRTKNNLYVLSGGDFLIGCSLKFDKLSFGTCTFDSGEIKYPDSRLIEKFQIIKNDKNLIPIRIMNLRNPYSLRDDLNYKNSNWGKMFLQKEQYEIISQGLRGKWDMGGFGDSLFKYLSYLDQSFLQYLNYWRN